METTMQKIGMKNNINLCESCCYQYPDCEPDNIIFGTAVGDDNIAACSNYEPITIRNPQKDSGRL